MSIAQLLSVIETAETPVLATVPELSLGNMSFSEFEKIAKKELEKKLGYKESLDESGKLVQSISYVCTLENRENDKAFADAIYSLCKLLDPFRKSGKKILSQPADDFNEKCLAIYNPLQFAQAQIKAQLKIFDDEIRSDINRQTTELITEILDELNVKPEFRREWTQELLDESQKLTNRTSTGKLTKRLITDCQQFAESCKQWQEIYYQRLELAKVKGGLELEDIEHFINEPSAEIFNQKLDAMVQRKQQRESEIEAKAKAEAEAKAAANREEIGFFERAANADIEKIINTHNSTVDGINCALVELNNYQPHTKIIGSNYVYELLKNAKNQLNNELVRLQIPEHPLDYPDEVDQWTHNTWNVTIRIERLQSAIPVEPKEIIDLVNMFLRDSLDNLAENRSKKGLIKPSVRISALKQ